MFAHAHQGPGRTGYARSAWPAVTLACVAAASLGMSGCAPPVVMATAGLSAAQAGVSLFTEGRLESAWEATLPQLHGAAKATLVELGYSIEGENFREDEVAFVASREPDGRHIEIYIFPSSPKVSLMSVRIGVFGDQPLSRLITDRIENQLHLTNGFRPPSAIEPYPNRR